MQAEHLQGGGPMTKKVLCILAGTGMAGLLALLGWTLYPTSPAAEAESAALVAANGSADVKIVGQSVQGPTEISLNTDIPINVRKVVHNDGPYEPVDVRTTKTATAPSGCTITPTSHVEDIRNIPVSVDVTINEPFTIRCSGPSWHTFTFNNLLEVTTAGVVDPNPSNNTWHTDWTVAAVTQADLEVVSQTVVGWPANILASVNVVVTLKTQVRNNGPYGPVDAEVRGWLSPPSGCTSYPNPAASQVTLNASETKTVEQQLTIHCLTGGLRTFKVYSRIEAKDPHIGDPNLANNELSRLLPSVGVTDNTDVKITSQAFVNPPSQIMAGENVDVTLRKHIHNNGPAGPIDVSISSSATAPSGCSVTAKSVPTSIPQVPVSVDQTVDEVWTIRCDQPSTHSFTFNNSVSTMLIDLYPNNNSASTGLTVGVTGQTDVEIAGQQVLAGDCTSSPPEEMAVSENTNICLRKTLHNKGPLGPVDVSISTSAFAPDDCSATPDAGNPTTASLPVSTDVVVDEIWTVHCDTPSSHSFSFDNAIAITTVHMTDSNQNNNSASTGLTVDAIGQADVEIAGQQVLAGDCTNSPPEEMAVSENANICLRKTLHNEGPLGPVDVSISTSASAPDDCSATPDAGNPTSASLPVDTDVVMDEMWTVHCDTPSSHSFSFDNAIAVTTAHIADPDQANNSASTGLTVDAIGQADVEVSQELVDAPSQIDVGEDVTFTLRKHLHNNGPDGPVNVSVSPSAYAPPGCTATLEDGSGEGSTGFASLGQQASSGVGANGLVVGFDMDPTGNSCPNDGSDCTLGLIDRCVEVSAGDVFQFDVFLDGIPTDDSVLGFAYDINTFPGTLTAKLHNSGTVNLVAQPGSQLLDFSDNVPDSSPPYAVNVGDLGDAEYNPPFTQGVLGRYTLNVTGVGTGVYGMTLENLFVGNYFADDLCVLYDCDIWDANSEPQYGLIAVDTDCPGAPPSPTPTPTIYTLTMAVSPSGAGTTIPPVGTHTYDEGTEVDLTAIPTSGYSFDSWSGDTDCSDGSVTMDGDKSCTANFVPTPTPTPTPIPTPTPPPGVITLPVSVDTVVDESWTIHCSEASTHSFSFDNVIATSDAHVNDPDPNNNSASTDLTVDAIGQADVKVVGVQVSGPAEIDIGEDVDITVSTTLHNNGSYGPVNVGLSYSHGAPADCSVSTAGPPQVSLPVSVDVVDNHTWTIHCSQPSEHTFSFQTDITGINDPHVIDPNEANNSGSAEYTVEAWASADLKVADQQFENPPTEIPVNQNVQITLDKVIHNNGSYGPVDAVTETTITVPPDCTVQPTFHVQEFHNVPVSVDIVHHEPFTIRCTEISSHEFVFNGGVQVTSTHVRDPNPANDTASTHLLLAVVAHTDVTIASIGFVNPPTKIPLNQSVDVTLRKHIHNHGPWGPVDISIAATATAPTGCTIGPKSVPSSLSNVPVSVDQVLDEVWTINCSQEGLKTFVFDNSIDVATLHVYDSYLPNNSTHKLLTVRDDSYPYWGADICDGKDNDGDTIIDNGWDLNGNTISDCLDPDLNSDCDEFSNDVDLDDDGDGWTDEDEGFMRTDPLNACPFDERHDAWPPDINNDGLVSLPDVLRFKGPIHGAYDRRYDINTDGVINIADVLLYKSLMGRHCPSCS
jgi:hypothetical protein